MTTTRENILEAASRLIHIRGFHNTSIDDILRESGVGKGNFYYYFKSKDELGYATLDRSLERIREDVLEETFRPERNPWEQLHAFLEALVKRAAQTGCKGGCPLGNLALEMSDVHEEFRHRLTQAFEQVQARLEEALERARIEGSLKPDADIPRLARFILAGFEGAILLGKLYKDPEIMAEVIGELQGHLAHYRVP